MASFSQFGRLQQLLVVISLFQLSSIASRKLSDQTSSSYSSSNHLHYHNGTLLTGRITIHLLWYGNFNPSQRAIISDFITSLSENNYNHPSVSTWWWKAIHKYYRFTRPPPPARLSLKLGKQILDQNYTLGKSLSQNQIVQVATKDYDDDDNNNNRGRNAVVNVLLTADDVAVEGFCQSKCGTHGYSSENITKGKKINYKKLPYIWVGNSESQCPGYCAWPPFHLQNQSPNNDTGLDGMVANFAGLLAATVTNPFGNGYYYYYKGQEPDALLLEAASACTGVYAAYLDLPVVVGASYNKANGANGRSYLVPAIYDPITSTCSTHI